MQPPLAFLNGQFLPYESASLPLHDAGFVLGATVTDLVRTFRHKLFRLDDHLARFRRSCELCQVPQPVDDDRLRGIALELVEANSRLLPPGGDLGLLIFATPGPVGFYGGMPGGAGEGPPTLGMHTFPLPFDRYRRLFTEGARLAIPSIRQPRGVDPRAKHRSRMHWWLASREAKVIEPLAEALLLDDEGHLTETASANLLIVRGGEALTPPEGTVLDGVSLRVVRELCGKLGIGCHTARLTPDDVQAADEVLLTCTTWCIAGASALDGQPVPWPGPLGRRLAEEWSQLAGMDIVGQILGNCN